MYIKSGVINKMNENDYSAQNEYSEVYDLDIDNNVYTDQGGCFWTPRGRICRDPRRGIECFYPRFGGRPSCRPFRPGFRPF